MTWLHPTPFILEHTVIEEEIDRLSHVNNQVYLKWMETIAWQHSLSVGVDEHVIKNVGKVMVIKQHQMNFHLSCHLNERLQIGTWVEPVQKTIKRHRFFQVIRSKDGKTVFTGQSLWVCINLKNQKPTKIPTEFIAPYQNHPS